MIKISIVPERTATQTCHPKDRLLCLHVVPACHPADKEMLPRSVFGREPMSFPLPRHLFPHAPHGTERPISTSVGFSQVAAPLRGGNVGGCKILEGFLDFFPTLLCASEIVPCGTVHMPHIV